MLRTESPPAPEADGYFGYVDAGGGDADGDGTPDLVFGTQMPVLNAVFTGCAHLIGGRDDQLRTFVVPEIGPDAWFSSVVATGREVGRDAATAVLVGAPRATVDDTPGRARLSVCSSVGEVHRCRPRARLRGRNSGLPS
jgi:hypothetical protein